MLKWTWDGPNFGRAKIPIAIASAFLIKREKDIFPDVGKKSYICSCKCNSAAVFVKGWKVKSDTVSNSKAETERGSRKPSSFESFV